MKVVCPFCQKKNLKIVAQPKGRKIYRCLECNLISAALEIANGQLSPKAKANMSTKDWYRAYLAEKPYLLVLFEKRLAEIKKKEKTGRLLDVGCATGLLLELAQKNGFTVYGLDISKQAISHCQKTIDPSFLFHGPLEKAQFKDKFFDLITVFDTLEHMTNLRSFLGKARRLLKTDGLLCLTVPNQACLLCRLLGSAWFDYKKLIHLYFFSPKTLNMVLEKNGFRIILLKKELFLLCSVRSAFTKLKRYYPHPLVSPALLLAEKLAHWSKIKSIFLPLEHLYVLAKKKS